MRKEVKATKWERCRKLFNDLHLWSGLIGGIFIFVICLTGTIYTFEAEVKQWLNKDLYKVTAIPGQVRLPSETLIANAEKATGSKAVFIVLPEANNAAITIGIANKDGKGRPKNYFVNPYTGAVLGDKSKEAGATFFEAVFKLHRWLLMDTKVGRPIVGTATLLFVFGCLTGIVIWFPKKIKNWRQGLKIKWNAKWKRLNHDLHNTLGFYSFVFLLLMGLTGLCWSFDWYRAGASQLIGTAIFEKKEEKKGKEIPTKALDESSSLALDSIVKTGNNILSYKGTIKIGLAKNVDEPLEFSKVKTGFFASPHSDKVKIEGRTGAVLSIERFSEKPFNQKLAASIKALHIGNIMGTFSKIIYFISCLIATSLPITGTMIWWNKLRKK